MARKSQITDNLHLGKRANESGKFAEGAGSGNSDNGSGKPQLKPLILQQKKAKSTAKQTVRDPSSGRMRIQVAPSAAYKIKSAS